MFYCPARLGDQLACEIRYIIFSSGGNFLLPGEMDTKYGPQGRLDMEVEQAANTPQQ